MELILLVLFLAVAGWMMIPRYNRLRKLKNAVERERSGVSIQIQRRHDLIDNLAEFVRAYSVYEGTAMNTAVAQRYQSGGVRRLLAVVEQYPNLRANSSFIQLARDLADTENKLANARNRFNQSVRNHNDVRNTFPDLIILGWFFRKERYFETDPEALTPFDARRYFNRF